jgi:hypothetical protein
VENESTTEMQRDGKATRRDNATDEDKEMQLRREEDKA